jgi:uncharacterized protein (DUF1330 family)
LTLKELTVARAYWISAYRGVTDPVALSEYGKLAGPALPAAGGRFLARGAPSMVYEGGVNQRTVLIEFDSVEQAIAAHDSPAYQAALRALGKCGRSRRAHRRSSNLIGWRELGNRAACAKFL